MNARRRTAQRMQAEQLQIEQRRVKALEDMASAHERVQKFMKFMNANRLKRANSGA